MKTYHVVAGIIMREGEAAPDGPGSSVATIEILATQRGYGDQRDGWEFPGGKIEPGETPEAALAREISEELAMDVCVGRHVTSVSYDYPKFHLEMACYLCTVRAGTPHLLEHEAMRWLTPDHIDDVDWLPADTLVVEALREQGIV